MFETGPGSCSFSRKRSWTGARVRGRIDDKAEGPVSLQMVLRALIDEGLKRERDRALLANVEGQMRAVREVRSRGRRLAAAPRPAKPSARASGRRG